MTVEKAHRRDPQQGSTSAPTIRPGTLSCLFDLFLPPPFPPSALAPSTLPGSCSSHCCHQPGQDAVLGHLGLLGVKANTKVSCQVGKSIKQGPNRRSVAEITQVRQDTEAAGQNHQYGLVSGPQLCKEEHKEGDSIFSAQRSSFMSLIPPIVGTEVKTAGLTSPTCTSIWGTMLFTSCCCIQSTCLRKQTLCWEK